MAEVREIAIEKISYGNTQSRVALKEEIIEEYRPVAKSGKFPPIVVFSTDNNVFYLGDGHYRREAHFREGLKTIKAEVRHGGLKDAILFAAGANDTHGQRRSNEDKHKSVQMILADEEWSLASDRWIADICKVGHQLVGKIRNEGHSRGQNNYTTGCSSSSNNNGEENSQKQPQDNGGCSDEDESDEQTEDDKDNTDVKKKKKPKRTGRDGKKRSSKKDGPILCERCARVGATPDCPGCAEARRKAGIDGNGQKKKPGRPRKKPEPKPEIKDKVGNVVPDHLRDPFADSTLPNFVTELETIASMFDPTIMTKKAGDLAMAHYGFILIAKFDEHIHQALESLQLAAETLRNGLPHAVCPTCKAFDSRNNGKTCKDCRGFGFVPEHQYAELTGATG